MTNRTIAEFVSHLKRLDVQLLIEGDRDSSLDHVRLRCNAPEGTLTTELRQELADRKAELISYLSKEDRDSREDTKQLSATHPLPPSPTPLSFAQQRLWFLYQLAPNNPFYNVPAAIRCKGTLDHIALKRSLQEIVRRHAALRTTFATVDSKPVQVVTLDVRVDFSVVNLQTLAASEREQISQQLATTEAQRPFNLMTDPLLRVTLLQFSSTEAILLLTLHHIIADGWSLGVLIRELASFYTALVEGRSPALPPLPMQYTDFALWQRHWLQGAVLEKQLTYWRQQLQDLPLLELPSDRPRPAVQTYRGATYPLQLSPTLTQALETLSQQSGVSLFMTLLAAFQTLLHHYTGQVDIAIGSPIANRHRSELEGLIGFFVNSLVLRTNLSGNPTFRELLERVRTVALEAYEHQDLPFEKLVEELEPDRDLSRNPLFQVAFALQNAPMQALELPGLLLEPAPLEFGSTRFDLEVHLWESAHGLRSLWQSQEGLSGFISYSTDLFDRDRIARLVGHFQTLLEGIVTNPEAHLSDLPILTPIEQQQILLDWSQFPPAFSDEQGNQTPLVEVPLSENVGGATQVGSPLIEVSLAEYAFSNGDLEEATPDLCFHHIFEAQVQNAPAAIALVTEQESLTYADLNQRSEDLAQTLRRMGVQVNSLVGLCVDRSADLVIGILGILKAGGAYVPLDPTYPSDRLHFMLTDTQVAILLTQSWLAPSLPAIPAQILYLDQPLDPTSYVSPSPQKQQEQSSLAYVIYTSGSTGTPKGVLLSHRGLCNVVAAQQQVFSPSYKSRVLQFSSLSFDASVFEIVLALGSGGALYIPPTSARLPGMTLVQFLRENAITHALLTPAVLAVLPAADLPDLQVLITGGETCSSQVIDRWAANRHFFNAYGPTENTIWTTVAKLEPGDNPLMIGRPILNTQVYILDANLRPVPAGIPGELYIGGVGLAQGYLNRPELTAERFVTNPFGQAWEPRSAKKTPPPNCISPSTHSFIHTSTLYKTGDRAQFLADGNIQFLGRVDHQIKIRGFRVELGEIEASLQRHPAIREVAVIAAGETSNEMRLMAYFSLQLQSLPANKLRSLQTQHLQHWQALYNQTYQPHASNAQFNTTGWNSSYTGEPIPSDQMQEWVSDRVQQILALNPKRVLEIGCGTGLLLFQIAPHCQQYVGTDFSMVSLEAIQHQIERLNLPQVELLHRMATDFDGIDAASFDVVLLNSIVQYFPSEAYLMQVVDQAIQMVAPGGVVFVGDVRSLPLLTAFHTWVEFCQADASLERDQLQQRVARSQFEEPELAIAPEFFHAMRDRLPQIEQVTIRLARGRGCNEMTQFRYNVLLQTPKSHQPGSLIDIGSHRSDQVIETIDSDQKYDWTLNSVTALDIKDYLNKTQSKILLITNIANSRVNEAVKVKHWLDTKELPKFVGRMRDKLQTSPEQAIDPQDWWDLETVIPYHVEITWSGQSQTGDYDVLLIRKDVNIKVDLRTNLVKKVSGYTNNPLQSNIARQLVPELRHYLKQTLPDYMLPAVFTPLEVLPLTTNGKVDRRSLLTFNKDLIQVPGSIHAPSTQTEATLIEIWQELLQIKNIDVHDNFFELGGHSLLATQMTSRIRNAFELELPLKSVFEAPTIAQLASVLHTLRDTSSNPKVPPLIRLDRSSHRRKREVLLKEPSMIQLDGSMDSSPDNLPDTQKSQATVQPATNSQNASLNQAWSPLVPLTLSDSKQPFFCVHPMFGVVFPYLELAHCLNSDRSFYGLQPLGLDGKSAPLNRMEAIAAYYIRAIQTLQPHGPYFLGGWSFGGLVAFEMAQQLTQAGESVELLAILDTPAPSHQFSLVQSLKFLLGTALWSTVPFLLDYGSLAANRLNFQSSWFARWQWSAIAHLIPEESRLRLLDESVIAPMLRIVYAHSQATYRYVAQAYPHRITLFKAADQPDAASDTTLGWNAFASDIQVHQVPGNHLSLLKQPYVQTLAQQLGQCLSSCR